MFIKGYPCVIDFLSSSISNYRKLLVCHFNRTRSMNMSAVDSTDTLSQLETHLANIKKNKMEVCHKLVTYNENIGGLKRGVEELSEQMRQLQTQAKNIEATKRTVVKVADKFNDSSKARVQLEKGATLELPELLASCDALQEAVRYARSLKKSTADAAAAKRLQEQEDLLSEAAIVLDNRFRGILTSQLKAFHFAKSPDGQHRLPAEVSFISRQEASNLYELARRMHGIDHLTDFAQHVGKIMEKSLKSCFAEVSAEAKKKVYAPGSHGILTLLRYYRMLAETATSLAIEVFKEEWDSYIKSESGCPHVDTFYQLNMVIERVTSASKTNVSTIGKLYLHLDLLQAFQEDWTVIPHIRMAQNPKQNWDNLAEGIEVRIAKLATAYCEEIMNPAIETPSDGTVFEITVQVAHLVNRINETYGSDMFDYVMFKHSQTATFRDYVENVYRIVSETVGTRANILIEKKKQKALSYLFRMNNIQYLAESIRKLGLSWVDDTAASLDLEVASLVAAYVKELWGRVVHPLKDSFQPRSSPSSDDREWIKKRLKLFNESLTIRLNEERTYQIPNKDLKSQLLRGIARSLNPSYEAFLKYTKLPFSRPVTKYIKYSPPLDRLLAAELFRGAA